MVRDNRFQGRVLETFVPYVHEVVVRYMAQSWVLQKSSKIAMTYMVGIPILLLHVVQLVDLP